MSFELGDILTYKYGRHYVSFIVIEKTYLHTETLYKLKARRIVNYIIDDVSEDYLTTYYRKVKKTTK